MAINPTPPPDRSADSPPELPPELPTAPPPQAAPSGGESAVHDEVAPGAAPSQNKRRAMYGLNVAVAVVVALALVVLVNVIVDWQYRRLPSGIKPWLRYDLTATRAYTLAPQTRKVLDGLDQELRMVSILRVNDKNSQDVADLLDEYARYSSKLGVEQINPDREIARLEAFYAELATRFTDDTAPLRQALDQGQTDLAGFMQTLQTLKDELNALAKDSQTPAGKTANDLRLLADQFTQAQATFEGYTQQIAAELAYPLPLLSKTQQDLIKLFKSGSESLLSPIQAQLKRQLTGSNASLKMRDAQVRLDRIITVAKQDLRQATEAVGIPRASVRYDRLANAFTAAGSESVVLLTPNAERVVPFTEMFTAGPADATGQPTAQFVGEDRLTGAMVTLQIAQPPLIVFVRDSPVSLIGQRGSLSHVAGRVVTADFEVTEWAVGGGGPASGQAADQAAVSAAPQPAEGQTAVWVVPPLSFDRTTVADREMVAGILKKRLAAGDGVLLNFSYDRDVLFRPQDPLLELAQSWGIVPQMDQLVMHESLGRDGRPQADGSWILGEWPADSPLKGALAGRSVQWFLPSPLALPPRPGVETQPLATLTAPTLWLAQGLTKNDLATARFDESAAADQAHVAAAAVRVPEGSGALPVDPGRLAVFTENNWLSNTLTTKVLGNSELFINTTYWLAGLDEAIAATPRSQDIRRIDAISDGRALTYRMLLLAVLPGATLLVGVAVWWVRRRG